MQPPAANDRAPGAELAPKGPRAKARRTERIERAPSSQECIEAFRRDIADAGIRMTGDIIANTPKIQRFHVVDQKKGTRNGWYRLFIDDGGAAGAFGDYKTGIKVKWSMKGAKPLTREERRDLAAKAKADKEQREAEEAERQANAAEVARSAFNAAAEAPAHHPYLKRKGVKSYGLRVAEWVKEWTDEETGEVHTKRVPNALLVPIRSPESKAPVSLQAIFPSAKNPLGRDKDFLSRARKRGCYFVIGKPVEINGRVVIVICEGYATGASIYEAVHETSGAVVIVAFDAGNLKPVAEHFRGMLPNAAIVIAGDNDVWTDTPIKNPGATRATEDCPRYRWRCGAPSLRRSRREAHRFQRSPCPRRARDGRASGARPADGEAPSCAAGGRKHVCGSSAGRTAPCGGAGAAAGRGDAGRGRRRGEGQAAAGAGRDPCRRRRG